MSTRNVLFGLSLAFAFGAGTAVAETPGLGKPINEADITAWNIDALPDGTGLPPGSGTPTQGAAIYSQKCAICHGENGVNPAAGVLPLVGPSKFDRIDTMKTVPYYKYATTLFDVMRRSMPYQMPKTLSNDELYALSAYILALNKIIGVRFSYALLNVLPIVPITDDLNVRAVTFSTYKPSDNGQQRLETPKHFTTDISNVHDPKISALGCSSHRNDIARIIPIRNA